MRRVLLLIAGLLAAALVRRAPAEPAGVPPVGDSGPVEGRRARPESETQRYARRIQTMRGFSETGPLDDRDVLRTLERAGVFAVEGPGFRPFHAPSFQNRWRWPLRAGVVSSEFGPRWGRRHEGLDIAADMGVPVFAAAGGVVLYAGDGLRGYGNAIILRHDQKTTSLYGHNLELKVAAGDRVERGQVIALLGSTGRSTGPHVHFEIRLRREAVDPR
ncbi:MAG TPA: M23 family metallopeptidase, partial [Elusimicrobiota bacterium]|nr:M23 family metallopeptidase [Elusimicrobiota bacterium]